MASVKQLVSIFAYDRLHFSAKSGIKYTGGYISLTSSLESVSDLGKLDPRWLVTDLTGYGLLEWDK